MFGLFEKEPVKVPVSEKAENVVSGVKSALSVFSNLIAELHHANGDLLEVVNECEQIISEHKEVQDMAKDSIQEYETLLQNLENVVGGIK